MKYVHGDPPMGTDEPTVTGGFMAQDPPGEDRTSNLELFLNETKV